MTFCNAGTQTVVLPAAESKRLTEYFPGRQRLTVFVNGHGRADERRRYDDALLGLMSVEDGLEFALHAEEGTLQEASMADREASAKPTGLAKDLSLAPKAQTDISSSPFRKAFDYMGCFQFVSMKDISRGGDDSRFEYAHRYKSDQFGNFGKTKSQMIAKSFTQVQDVNYHETSPIPASAPLKITTVASNELGLTVLSRTFV